VIDHDLLGWNEVWAAAGTPDAVFPLTPAELLRVSGAREVDLAERPDEDPAVKPGEAGADR
jgi:prolyl-tRNA editing enzyme YbaK/EbsC (Cys-tRNA(Pro) deacylase)